MFASIESFMSRFDQVSASITSCQRSDHDLAVKSDLASYS